MKVALCGNCKDFLQSNHNAKLRRLEDSREYERSASIILEAADSGCRLCETTVRKFRSLQSDLLSPSQTNDQPVRFQLLIRPYWNTNCQSPEEQDRPFLRISISQQQIEFRLWRVPEILATAGAAYDYHGTGSETSFAKAKEWFHECILEHDNCNGVNIPKNWIPSRLIDVGSRPPFPDTVKLRQTKDWQTSVQYAALSHCWGAVQPIKLLQKNVHTLMSGISTVDLPKTFRDAIYATRKFGLQYLWIDSLCIIQDSNEDWDFESSLMTHVYGGCLLNFAAASSRDCMGGLFQNRPSSYLGPCFVSVESQNDTFISYYQLWDQDIWPVEFESATLNKRAWVMQERMLSPRTLAFSKTQVFWECRCKRASEEFPSDFPIESFEMNQMYFKQPLLQNKLKVHALNRNADSRLGDDPIRRLSLAWHNLVMLYSTKDMTFEEDKLVAISGLAELFAAQMGTSYFAGLWKSTLLKDLLWEVDAEKSVTKRPLKYRAPSWSWASVECPVKYLPGWIKSNQVTVINVKIQTVSQSQFGRVSGGYLQFQGRLFSDFYVGFQEGFRYFLKKRGQRGNKRVAYCMPDEPATFTDPQLEILCLPIGSYVDTTRALGEVYGCKGLMLITQRNQPRGYYKRLGTFEAFHDEFFKDPNNQVAIDRYVEGKEDMIVVL